MTSTTQSAIAKGTLGRRINTEKLHLLQLIFTSDYSKISHQRNLLTALEEAAALLSENFEGGVAAVDHKHKAAARRLEITIDLDRYDLVSQVAGESAGWGIASRLLTHIELEEQAG